MSDSSKAVFLSYAHEDADVARRLAEALRGAGIAVWFDESEFRGGEAWDQKIRRQIKECALFVPIISAHTEARGEGYFRLEWKLADERTALIAKGLPFLLPVVADDTSEADAMVPDSFRAVQWMRLPGGEPAADFAAQVKRLVDAPRRHVDVGRGHPTPPQQHADLHPAGPEERGSTPTWPQSSRVTARNAGSIHWSSPERKPRLHPRLDRRKGSGHRRICAVTDETRWFYLRGLSERARHEAKPPLRPAPRRSALRGAAQRSEEQRAAVLSRVHAIENADIE